MENEKNTLSLFSPTKDKEDKETKEDPNIEIVPFKKVLLKIFKEHNKYYLLDRTKYDLNTIMMLLDLNKINKLAEFFKGYKEGIEKVVFIAKMKTELPNNLNDPMDEANLVYGLYKFFCEIDFNGDEHMQWEEFTQFIIDTVEGDNEAKINENEDDNNNKLFNEKEMIKFKRYHLSKKLKDNLIHKREIISAVFLSRINMLIMNEYGTRILKIYNPRTGRSDKTVDLDTYLQKEPQYLENSKNYKKNKKTFNYMKAKPKEQEKLTITTTYSVLFLSKYQNIVAMCLSDKRIVFFNFPSDDRIELIFEMTTPVLEKRVWFLPEHGIWVSSGCKMDKFPYYTLNELDIEFSLNNQKYECLFNEGHPYRKNYCEKIPHKGEIMDCIEILRPKMVLTACLDGKIRLINLYDRDNVKVWCNHSLGVRSLDYNPLIDNIGYILSVGFEYYINVYCTDLSIDEAFKGKLEGHYAPVISCKFLSYSYMAVSVDEEGNVRIWDTKQKICLQLIPTPKKNLKINNLLVLPKFNKFFIYGNKLIYYDAHYKEEANIQKNAIKDDNYPIKVEYNKYYHQFFITTLKDVRVYNKDGQLFKCYKKLIANEHFESDVTIKEFLFENNYRKFYLGFSNGAIMQFNAGNGSLIKAVNEDEEEKDGIQTYVYSHSKDITALYYYHDESLENSHHLLLSTSYDSLINVYNEKNPEETEKLRTIHGGHTLKGKVLEINCMDFSILLNLFATAGSDGLIVCWDFEMSKIDDIFYFHSNKLSVNFVKFLEPYPILAAGYSDGTLYFWGVKQNKERGECIFRARNYFKQYRKIDLASIKYMNIISGNLPEINYSVPLRKYFDENSPFMNNNNKIMNNKKSKYTKYDKIINEEKAKPDNKAAEENELDLVPEIYKDEIIDYSIDPNIYEEVNNDNDEELKKKIRNRLYLIIGDSQGNIKLIDIMGFVHKKKLEPASKVIIKSSFNILKKDDINAETILNHNIFPKDENQLPVFTNMYHKMIQNEFQAHMDEITCITVVESLSCFISSSKDKFVKIFNYDCECLGVINSLPKLAKYEGEMPKWKFNIDEKKILEDEIYEVVGIFEKVGVETILVGSKTDKEVENIQITEKNEAGKKNMNDFKDKTKKKFQKIEKVEKKKEKSDIDDNKVVLTYEGFYVQEAEKKIESMINVDVPKLGINEITSKAIGTVIDNNKKIKRLEEIKKEFKGALNIDKEKEINKSKKLSFRNSLAQNLKHNIRKTSSKKLEIKSKNKIPKINMKYINNNLEDNQQTPISTTSLINIKIPSSKNAKKTNIENTDNIKEKLADEEMSKLILQKTSTTPRNLLIENMTDAILEEINNKNHPKSSRNNAILKVFEEKKGKNYDKSQTQKNISVPKRNLSNIEMLFDPFKKRMTRRRNKSNYKINNRNGLFSASLFSKTYGNLKDEGKLTDRTNFKENFTKKINTTNLPYLNEKIIFSRGETEKLLNYHFYSTSYRACCQTAQYNNMPNSSMKANFKNNWKMVRNYVNEKKENEIRNQNRKERLDSKNKTNIKLNLDS